jgi:hypothetical protein
MSADVPCYEAPSSKDQNPYEADFATMEVWKRLSCCSNTSSASVGIRYLVWKKFNEGVYVLSTIFNCVKRLRLPWVLHEVNNSSDTQEGRQKRHIQLTTNLI